MSQEPVQTPKPEIGDHIKATLSYWQNSFKNMPRPVLIVTLVSLFVLTCCYTGTIANMGGGKTTTVTAQPTKTAQNNNATSAPGQPTATTDRQPQWTTFKSFSGNGSKTTEVFHTPDQWRIQWSCTVASIDAPLFVHVLRSDGSGAFEFSDISTTCKTGNTSDVVYEHKGGDVYIEVISGIDWKLDIQEMK